MSLLLNSGTFYIYAFGLFLNWRQLALVATLSAIPYVLGMIFVIPDDFFVDEDVLLSISANGGNDLVKSDG